MPSTPSVTTGRSAGIARSSADRPAPEKACDVRPEAVDKLPRYRRDRTVRGVDHADLELEPRLEGALHDAARGVLVRGEGVAKRDPDAGAGQRADDFR